MRTFVIFPKRTAIKIEASTQQIALKRYLKMNPGTKANELSIALDNWVDRNIDETEITENKEQGVVITETPKPAAASGCQRIPAFNPEA